MSAAVHDFTTRPLRWSPYITPVRIETASDEQREALKITPSNRKVSDYVLTLAHDPESLAVRSPLFNEIMYGKDGLPHAERELAAVAASIVNHCVYCTSVHAARYVQLTKREDTIAAIFTGGTEPGLDEHSGGLFEFATALSETPSQASTDHVRVLRNLGLDDLAIVDLILASSIFGWANRLMHTLGEPLTKD